jgi:response regulator RpfG family c-di-GMP phosphodiesterase
MTLKDSKHVLREEARANSVLVVDDEHCVRNLMARWLESGGYDVTTAASAEEALGQFETTPPAVALCDIRMPGHDGIWLAEQIRHQYPETAVIMATGVHDVGPAVASLRQGVIDYLTKPFGRDRLREWHESAWDARRWRESLEQEMTIRRTRISDAIAAVKIHDDETLDSMIAMLTLTDRDAYAHGYRVAALAVNVARMLGLPDEALSTIGHGALLHDIGKLAVPEAVLRKPAALTVEEVMLVRRHPAIGSDIIAAVPYLEPAAPIVRQSHERVDGLGYPHGVRGSEISIGARIVCVADAYDTMTRPRVFRDAIGQDEALLELERCSGTQFDPLVVEAFSRMVTALQKR